MRKLLATCALVLVSTVLALAAPSKSSALSNKVAESKIYGAVDRKSVV